MPEVPNEKLYGGAAIEPPAEVAASDFEYAELDVTSNFSFLRGASHPDELVFQAALLGYKAMAITDINTVAGVVRAYNAARKVKGFKFIVGSRLTFTDGTPDLMVWPMDRAAYSRLCRLLTLGRRRAPKGECHLTRDDFLGFQEGMCAATMPTAPPAVKVLHHLREAMGDRLSLAIHMPYGDDDQGRLRAAMAFSREMRIPLLATNHVHYHDPGRKALQDVLTCVRHGCTIHQTGGRLFGNAERYLKSPEQMHRLFAACPAAIERGLEIARRCTFSLKELQYEYPMETVPAGMTHNAYLRQLTYEGARVRYPGGIPPKVTEQIEKELAFIERAKYASYFLTVYDLVREARSRSILCQGRGSAANSAVCFCLGVTGVDPDKFQLVFERFASDARQEPPDIDIDFEHEEREQVIQYVYEKYGRDRAGMTATLITYRGRSAVRDVGKALGLSQDLIDKLAGQLDWWHRGTVSKEQLAAIGVNGDDVVIRQLMALSGELLGFPRHLSQHPGGMVIARSPLCELVPVENARMEDRTVIEWDKDDLDIVGLFKVDILALGMLTAIAKCFKLVAQYHRQYELHTIPHEDPETYEMIGHADTIGVFQIESRAQMSMLPRLRPQEFYDLVIEVAIVRPGPIQGDMVHPYLQRREAVRRNPDYKVPFPSEELRHVLERTLGVPLFQEQAMQLAMVGAGFTGTEADDLRRSMASWKRSNGIERFRDKFIGGMLSRGYKPDFTENCFKQISGFGEYGFPESHAASFAKLVYVSCWLKRHHPAAFTAALLNSQPMGFYAPAQLVRDAREHGVMVRPVDVNHSHWDSTLEYDTGTIPATGNGVPRTWGRSGPAVRLGFRQVSGMRKPDADKIVAARHNSGRFYSVSDLQHAADLDTAALERLAEADAMASLQLNRREALWDAMAQTNIPAPLVDGVSVPPGKMVQLPLLPMVADVHADYRTTGLSLKAHPVSFAREALNKLRVTPAVHLKDPARCPHDRKVRVAGLVLVRQRPGTASGVVFATIEDETGVANLIFWSRIYEMNRVAARHATLLQVDGLVQREGEVVHVIVSKAYDRSNLLSGIKQPSRDFH